jgi:hypothetical protein
MSRNLDRALEVLSGHETQHSPEPAVARPVTEDCWRCAQPSATPVGLCAPCGAWLSGESDYDPAEDQSLPAPGRVQHGHPPVIPDGVTIPIPLVENLGPAPAPGRVQHGYVVVDGRFQVPTSVFYLDDEVVAYRLRRDLT